MSTRRQEATAAAIGGVPASAKFEQMIAEAHDALDQRLARRLPLDHPAYDAFYDASDEELAEMVRDSLSSWPETRREATQTGGEQDG